MDGKAAREFSEGRREKMAGAGVAMPDGSYPIPDKDALRRAIQSFGRAKDPAATKRHIIKRARALGATDMLPADWKGAGKGSMAAQHSAQAADILEDLYELIDCESDEPAHVTMLQQAASIVARFMADEAAEIGQPGDDVPMMGKARGVKRFSEMKAEPMDSGQLDRWLSGQIPRRLLMVPFGGPLPGGKAGLDLDGEYFDEASDIYGPFPYLRKTRERLVDWHHDEMYRKLGSVGDPLGRMKGAILGRVVFDDEPEQDGIWADWWAQAGEQRMALIRSLERRNVPIYGSTQAVAKAARVADDGHIDVWPVIRHTVSTSPQNTFAVVPPLKALLTADLPDDIGIAAIKAALVGLDGRSFSGGGRGFRQSGEYVLTERDRRIAREIGVAIRRVALG